MKKERSAKRIAFFKNGRIHKVPMSRKEKLWLAERLADALWNEFVRQYTKANYWGDTINWLMDTFRIPQHEAREITSRYYIGVGRAKNDKI